MEVELRAGATIDLASGAELREQTDTLVERLERLDAAPLMQTPRYDLIVSGGGTIGGGVGGSGQATFQCPQGYAARVVRWAFNAPGSTPAAPLAAGWIQAYVDSPSSPANLAMQTPPVGSTTVLPAIFTDGSHSAVMLRDQQTLTFIGAALTPSLQIGVGLQIWLYALP